MFASIPVFDEIDFKRKSGWYMPTVADVSCCSYITIDCMHSVSSLCHSSNKKWINMAICIHKEQPLAHTVYCYKCMP